MAFNFNVFRNPSLREDLEAMQTANNATIAALKTSTLVADAAGANPTKAEYDALLAALKAAGLMATE